MSGSYPWKLADEMHPSHSGIYQKQYTQITLRPPSLNLTRYTQQMRFQPALNKTFSPSCHQTPAGNQSTPNHENKMRRLFFFNKRFTISNIEKQIIFERSQTAEFKHWHTYHYTIKTQLMGIFLRIINGNTQGKIWKCKLINCPVASAEKTTKIPGFINQIWFSIFAYNLNVNPVQDSWR